MQRFPVSSIALVLLVCASSRITAASKVQGQRTQAAPQVAQPVDDNRCIDCHPGQTQSWRQTGMGRALGSIENLDLSELAEVSARETGYSYAFAADQAPPVLVERYRSGAESQGVSEVNRWPLAFSIGAGDLDRSFALQIDGRWWLAPLELVSSHTTRAGHTTARHAALAPSHTMRPDARATQPITPECLACHTEALPPLTWPLNTAPAASDWKPTGISCGACHARAEAHANWREDDLAGLDPTGDDPLVSHADFSRTQRMSVCAACHLQGDARLELVPRRFGIPEPGGDLLDVRAVYVGAKATSEVGFASQTERLVLSRCYLESAGDVDTRGGLSCETCHDPHRSVYGPEESDRVRGACQSCHALGEPSAARPARPCSMQASERPKSKDCADCHMPETPVFDVAGVRIHDHWIRKRPQVAEEATVLRFDEAPDGNWRRFRWPDTDPPRHVADKALLMMALASRGHAQAAQALVDTRPGLSAVRLPMYHHVKAGVLEASGRLEDAERAYRVALALDPNLAASSVNLGLLLARTKRPDLAVALLTPVIAAHPTLDSALRNRALAYRALDQRAEFARDLEQAFRLHPNAELALALAQFYLGQSDPTRADRWRAAAQRLQPTIER